MGSLPTIDNRTARRIFLARHQLSGDLPKGTPKARLRALIDRLGFVQVDSVNTLARAHDLILFSRLRSYRPAHLRALVERDRELFENWTHDAAIIPARFFPYWQRRFVREAEALRVRWRKWRREGFEAEFERVLTHVARTGPVRARELCDRTNRGDGWWDWHPSKTALEYLWRTGALAVTRREGFEKVYDLTENVIRSDNLARTASEADLIDWACRSALDRLGFATSGELAAFWGLISAEEARSWYTAQTEFPRALLAADGRRPREVLTRPGLLDESPPVPSGSLRLLSPFDPLLRDRTRTERLFCFSYRIEIFVPELRRQYGYYVFPVLEGDRLIGRMDAKADRGTDTLSIRAFWPEPGISLGKARQGRLDAELDRLSRFAGLRAIDYCVDWRRDAANP